MEPVSVFLIVVLLIIIIYCLHKRKTTIVLPSSSRLSSAHKKPTIAIMGSSGSGKSTLRKALGRLYNVSTLELDTVYFVGEDWKEHPKEVMRQKVRDFIHAHQEEGWVIDGSYRYRVGDIVLSNADVVVFFNYNLFINLWRVCIRSVKRIMNKEDLFGNNHETWVEFPKWFSEYPNLEVWQLRSPAETQSFIEAIQLHLNKKST